MLMQDPSSADTEGLMPPKQATASSQLARGRLKALSQPQHGRALPDADEYINALRGNDDGKLKVNAFGQSDLIDEEAQAEQLKAEDQLRSPDRSPAHFTSNRPARGSNGTRFY